MRKQSPIQKFAIRKYNGFNIVEVMVAVLIVGILATMASTGYKRYMAKSQLAKTLAATAVLQQTIQDFYQNQGFLPGATDLSSLTAIGYVLVGGLYRLNNPTPDVQYWDWNNSTSSCSVGVSDCDGTGSSQMRQIEIVFNASMSFGTSYLAAKDVMLVANLTGAPTAGGTITWVCMPYPSFDATFDSSLFPATCFSSALMH